MIRLLTWVWMGIVIGMPFLATPIRFTADSHSRPAALDIGRATFHAVGYLEWVLVITLVLLIWRAAATGKRPTDHAQTRETPNRSPIEVNA